MTVPVASIRDLSIECVTKVGMREVVRSANLEIQAGEAVGLVGESGSGKSMTARTLIRMLPRGASVRGQAEFDGADVLAMRGRALRPYRASQVAMIFQDPRAHINPVRRIGDFMTEGLRHAGVGRAEAVATALELLESIRVRNAENVLQQYPHQLSGGMLQRVMIAAAIALSPRLLLADEPTTALDVTTQAEVIGILDNLRRERNMALLFITHDLELAEAICDRTVVMYAGRSVEMQPATDLYSRPLHPYTAGLLRSRPTISQTQKRLTALPGWPVAAFEAPTGCAFADRCHFVEPACRQEEQTLRSVGGGLVACRRAEELEGHLLSSEDRVEHG